MAYFKIGNVDFSSCVSSLEVEQEKNYNAQMNAGGDTVVDYINTKYHLSVGIIPIESAQMVALMGAIQAVQLEVSFREPLTGNLKTITCMVPKDTVEYYTIRTGKVQYKEFELEFQEL